MVCEHVAIVGRRQKLAEGKPYLLENELLWYLMVHLTTNT